jgi:hypothetical protein
MICQCCEQPKLLRVPFRPEDDLGDRPDGIRDTTILVCPACDLGAADEPLGPPRCACGNLFTIEDRGGSCGQCYLEVLGHS